MINFGPAYGSAVTIHQTGSTAGEGHRTESGLQKVSYPQIPGLTNECNVIRLLYTN